jgi:hypothetical protein
MRTDGRATQAAKEYVDSALAERSRLGYTARISKKSYGRAVAQAAGVFARLDEANGGGAETASTEPDSRTPHPPERTNRAS